MKIADIFINDNYALKIAVDMGAVYCTKINDNKYIFHGEDKNLIYLI
jgi:hypothetical protein